MTTISTPLGRLGAAVLLCALAACSDDTGSTGNGRPNTGDPAVQNSAPGGSASGGPASSGSASSASSVASPGAGRAAESAAVATVRVVPVERQNLQTWIFSEGTARAIRREFLSFESAGRVSFVDPDLKEGDTVRAGQVIAYQQQDLANADLANAEAAIVEARTQRSIAEASVAEATANLSLAERTFGRYKTLLAQESASQQEYEESRAKLAQARAAKDKAKRQYEAATAQIAAAQAQLSRTEVVARESRLVSPMDGTLARLNIEQGYYFSPQQVQSTSEANALNTVPVVIIDASAFELTVSLPSYAYQQVQVGNAVRVEPAQRQNQSRGGSSSGPAGSGPPAAARVNGSVYAVSPSVDPQTRTFAVKVRTTDGAASLQDGSYVTAWIAGPAAPDALSIPLSAIRYDQSRPFVFTYDAATSTVARTNVTLGLQADDRQQVLAGLSESMQVVTDGRSAIADGDRVRLVAPTAAFSSSPAAVRR